MLLLFVAVNLAFSKPAWQVPPAASGDATKATDCSIHVSETLEQTQTSTGDRPFWAVDLGEAYEIIESEWVYSTYFNQTVLQLENHYWSQYEMHNMCRTYIEPGLINNEH